MSTITIIIDAVNSASGKIQEVTTDFKNLGANVKAYQSQLAAATPQNQKFASEFDRIRTAVSKGEMSIADAQAQVGKLSAQISAANPAAVQHATTMEQVSTAWKSGVQTAGQIAGAVGLVAVGFNQVWQAAKEGAVIELNNDRFRNLAESIGTTADSLNQELSGALQGMVTDAKQVELANQIISLGLANSEDGVVRLARLITENGWDMQQVIITFANNSKMRLDALGLSVTDVDARMEKFIAQGIGMDQAFDLAVIEAGEAKLELLGSAADSSVGDMARAEAAIGNFVDGVKTGLVPVLGDAAAAFTNLTTIHASATSTLATHNLELVASGMAYEDYVAEMERAIESGGLILGVTGMQVEKEKILTEAMFASMQRAKAAEASELKLATARASSSVATAMLAENMAKYAENTFYANQSLGMLAYVNSAKFADRLQAVNEKAVLITESMQDLQPKVDALADTLNQKVGSPLTQFIEDIEFFAASGGRDFAAEFQRIQDSLAMTMSAESTTPAIAAQAMQQAQEAAAKLLVDWEKVRISLGQQTEIGAAEGIAEALGIEVDEALALLQNFDGAADAIFGEERAVAMNTNSLDELHEKLLAAEGDITSLGEKAKAIEGTYNIIFELSQNGTLPNVGGISGGAPSGPVAPQGFSQGANFVVPPGYPNDSYGPLYVESGERVQITPAGQAGQGGVQITFGNIIIQSQASDPAAVARAVMDRLGTELRTALTAGYGRM